MSSSTQVYLGDIKVPSVPKSFQSVTISIRVPKVEAENYMTWLGKGSNVVP